MLASFSLGMTFTQSFAPPRWLDFRNRQVFFQLQGEGLAVAAHRADAYAQAVDYGRIVAAAEDFVGFHAALPFFFGLAVAQIYVNPRNQAAGERVTPKLALG